MNFRRRVSRLERRMIPERPQRVVLRFEGPGTEGMSQPEEDIDENTLVVVIHAVETRPVEPTAQEGGYLQATQMIAGDSR